MRIDAYLNDLYETEMEKTASTQLRLSDLSLDELRELACGKEKTAGLRQPDLPRAKDVIKGRGPAVREARDKLRSQLRSTCPPVEKKASAFSTNMVQRTLTYMEQARR